MKYSEQEIKTMARESLRAKENHDPRYFQLIMSISMITGIPASEVESRIERLSK